MKFVKQKCYAFVGYAPKGTSLREAAVAFNNFVADKENGLALYHDHFVNEPGALAVFFVESEFELKGLEEHRLLSDWTAKVHPLTFTEKPIELLYQADYTMGVYRGKRLRDLVKAYSGSEYERSVDENVKE